MIGQQLDLVLGDQHGGEELAAAAQGLGRELRGDRGARGQAHESVAADGGPPCTKMRDDGQHGLLVGDAPGRESR